jgi:hypothetical protein
MKIYIGPYREWVGPYQLADLLQKVGVSEDRCHRIGKWLSNTWVCKFCEWVDKKKKIKTNIRIDDYDVWSMDYTLSLIILPMLKKLKENKHGAPFVADADVPEGLNLRRSEAPPVEFEYDTDDNFFKRWDWIMDELIWTFEQLASDNRNESQFYDHSECTPESEDFSDGNWSKSKVKVNHDGLRQHDERIKNGLILFGKYYQALWD